MNPIQQRVAAGIFLGVCVLGAATLQAGTSFYEQGRKAEEAGKWEEAYQAYVQSVEHGEAPAVEEDERPIDRVFLVATEHLGWFDEANAYAEQYLSSHKDGYLHRLRGYFYKDKLHDFDKAREQFRKSYDDYKAAENQLHDALYSLDEEAECYRTQLFEMEYYTNHRNRQAFTRKAHDILLEGFSQVDNVVNEWERESIRNIFMDSLAYIYAQNGTRGMILNWRHSTPSISGTIRLERYRHLEKHTKSMNSWPAGKNGRRPPGFGSNMQRSIRRSPASSIISNC